MSQTPIAARRVAQLASLALAVAIAAGGPQAAAQPTFELPGAPDAPTTYAELIEAARPHAIELQAAHQAIWSMADHESWAVDLDQGLIEWRFADGRVARAPVEFLGTWSPADETFLWAWDHPSASDDVNGAARALKAFADRHGVAELTARKTTCAFDACWDLAAAAVLVADLSGVYRAEAAPGGPWAYFGFHDVTLLNASVAAPGRDGHPTPDGESPETP